MKVLAPILVAATAISSCAAAAAIGYIETYQTVDCTEVDGVVDEFQTNLPLNACEEITTFGSFKAGLEKVCPKGKVASIVAYSGMQCDGNSVSAGTLPTSGDPGACKEIVAETGAGGVSLAGRSAMFMCI